MLKIILLLLSSISLFFSCSSKQEMHILEEEMGLKIVAVNVDSSKPRTVLSVDSDVFERHCFAFTPDFRKWTGDILGLFCWNEKEEKGFIDVVWSAYAYDGPKPNSLSKCSSKRIITS